MWKLAATVGALTVAATAAAFGIVRGDENRGSLPRLPEEEMSGRLLVGFQDEPTLRWGADRMAMLGRARRAGAAVIRTTVNWAQAAPRRPLNPASPFDPAYRLDDVDELARNAQARGMELLITIWGTPPWANGGGEPNVPPSDPADLAGFAQTLSDRYSGRHSGYPAVRLFSAWNEPNLELFLSPQFDAQVAPRHLPRTPVWRARLSTACAEGTRGARGHRRDVRAWAGLPRVWACTGEPFPGASLHAWSRSPTRIFRSTRGLTTRTRRGPTSRRRDRCDGPAWG